MASLGHLAVGMAAARGYRADSSAQRASWGALLAWAALSFLPDADVIGFGFGLRYEDEWGHRGATHSLAFALAVGATLGLLAPLVRRSAVRTGVMATLVLASHSLLDSFTDGGLGCALLWPFDDTRYFAPWRPLPVSPIGLGYLSPYGMYVAVTEIALFAPVLWYAFRSRAAVHAVTSRGPMRALLIVGWLISIWLLMSSDPLRERAVGSVLSDTTQFTAGFSDARFSAVQRCDSAQDVRVRLGTPFSEFLLFDERPNECGMVRVDSDIVAEAQPPDPCSRRGVQPGVARAAVLQALGIARQSCWFYSRSLDHGYYRARGVCFDSDRVANVVKRWLKE